MLCEKCGLPITGPAGRCTHCDPPNGGLSPSTTPPDPARGVTCSICTAPLEADSFGTIICTGCGRSVMLCGCGSSRPSLKPAKMLQHEPKAEWWLARLTFLVRILRENEKTLNREGASLLKFALYSTLISLTDAANKQNKRKVYDAAVALLPPLEGLKAGS